MASAYFFETRFRCKNYLGKLRKYSLFRLNKNQMLIHTVVFKKGIKKCLKLEKVYERDETPCG